MEKQLKSKIKNSILLILAFALGVFLPMGIAYATHSGYLYDSDEVSYSNTTSGLTSTDVQDALDELNDLCYD